jgi:hypothetical protein
MAIVYLPMGYPLVSGAEAETIIYQGQLVRSYTLPNDPRSDSQLFSRKFLSDVSKMRSKLGAFGKLAMKETLGSAWSTVIFQLVKSDSDGWWSEAGEIWDSMTDEQKNAWRSASPYQLTFNDVGLIFFSLARVVFKALEKYRGNAYLSAEWGADDSAAAAAWWAKSKLDSVILATLAFSDDRLSVAGAWNLENGFYKTTVQGQGSILAVINAREGRFHYGRGEDLGVGYLQFGNDEPIEINGNVASGWGTAFYDFDLGRKRFLSVRFYPGSDARIGFSKLDIQQYTS